MKIKLLISVLLVLATLSFSCSKNDVHGIHDHLHVYQSRSIPSLDPVYMGDVESMTMGQNIFDSLYEIGYEDNTKIIPLAAEEMPKVKDAGLTYIIRIKPGMMFHENPCFKEQGTREVTAYDFVYSVKRVVANPEARNIFYMKNTIAGLDSFSNTATRTYPEVDYSKEVSGLKAIDKYTIMIKLVRACSSFLITLTRPGYYIVPREAVEFYGKDFGYHPIGSGPYYIHKRVLGSKITLKKNMKYKHSVEPQIRAIHAYVMVEEQPRWLNFKMFNLDIVKPDKDIYSEILNEKGELSSELQKLNVKLQNKIEPSIYYIAFNMNDRVVGGINGPGKYLRQAMSHAYDLNKFIEIFYNKTQAIASNWVIPKGIYGHDPSYKNPYTIYSIAKAKDLLEKAGFPNGKNLPEINFDTRESTNAKQEAEFFAKNMSNIGIRVNTRVNNWPLMIKRVNGAKDLQIFSYRWLMDYPATDNMLIKFYGKETSPGPNHSLISIPEYDKLYEKFLETPKGPKKLSMLKKMRSLIVEQAVFIGILNPISIVLNHAYVENYKFNPVQDMRFKFYKLNFEAKKELLKKAGIKHRH